MSHDADTAAPAGADAAGAAGAWSDLFAHKGEMDGQAISDLFRNDPKRFDGFSLSCDDLLVDFSKTLTTDRTLHLLRQLAEQCGLTRQRDALLSGGKVNRSEDRPALHTALRAPPEAQIFADGTDVVPQVHSTLTRMLTFAEELRGKVVMGAGGEPLCDVVYIGIGGSILGPAAIVRALTPYQDHASRLHFVSNIDGAHLHDVLGKLTPARTLFVIASKTFTTQETMTNAASARRWIAEHCGPDAPGKHFAAITGNPAAAEAFGVGTERIFTLPDWVGGRYSPWSATGLPVAFAAGTDHFRQLLAGARAMDEHFATAPLDQNLPVTLALIGIWHRSILGYASRALVPYDQRLDLLIDYLRQVEMESNAKSTGLDGEAVRHATAGVLWGGTGTDAQHSFFQFLHQGTDITPVEFLVAATPGTASPEDIPDHYAGHHEALLANCLAQSQALMVGRSEAEAAATMPADGIPAALRKTLARTKTLAGNRPSVTILYRTLTPYTLGMLLALHEHRTFAQGVIWGINSFDQWGVEFGKELATRLLPAIKGDTLPDMDGSTAGLIEVLRRWRGGK